MLILQTLSIKITEPLILLNQRNLMMEGRVYGMILILYWIHKHVINIIFFMNTFALESKSIDLSKETLSYFEVEPAGVKKSTLLLIHGHFGSKQVWHDTIHSLGNKYHVIAVDLRGFGESTCNQKCSQLKNWADDLVEFCGQMGISKCITVGWCFGGLISMKLAEIAPQLVDKMVLFASVGYQGLNIQKLLKCWLIMKQLIQQQKRQQYSKIFYGFIKADEKQKKFEDMIDGAMRQRYIDEVHKLIQKSGINIQDITPTLQKSLAIHGSEDHVVEITDFLATGQRCKKFMKLAGLRHMVQIQFTTLTTQIEAFIQ